MAESITITANTKEAKYKEILPQIESLISYESDITANLANVAAVLKETFGFFWVGFYVVKNDELVLGPFQGPLACTRIQLGKGVCGKSWLNKKSIVVEDVDAFPGHIACSSASKSEVVVPILNDAGDVLAIIDVDSDQLADFDQIDAQYLEVLSVLIAKKF